MIDYRPLYSHAETVYNLPGFAPGVVDAARLERLGVDVAPSPASLEALERG